MSDVDRYFHEVWLGMVQPVDGLVVSIPVLVDAQCMERQPPNVQQKLLELCPSTREGEGGAEGFAIADLGRFFSEFLGLGPELFDVGDALPEPLSLYVPEGKQTLRATMGLKKQGEHYANGDAADSTPVGQAGSRYEMLVWDLPRGLDLDKPEATTGTWDYPPAAKFERLLRHCRVWVGLLTNRDVVRLIYAPHGESSGAITFRLDDMASVGGRPILDALVMLLSANRFFGVSAERTLSALLAESRKRQANVTNDLADQVFEALQILLRGFEAAAERGGRNLLEDALAREHDHLYKGLLTVLLRLVFLLYAEDRGLLPVEHPIYAAHLSVLGLFEQLQADRGAYPDSMSRRFGAWGRLVTVFRAIFLGIEHGTLTMPARRGSLFNPHEYPFLEGWGPAGSAPITQPEDRAAVSLPTVDDETVFRLLEKLLLLDGQRLSYRALDVEQIGSVYEALMGYHVLRMPSEAVCMKPDRLWVSAEEVLEVAAARRAKWLKEAIGINAAQSERLNVELTSATNNEAVLEALAKFAAGGRKDDPSLSKARAGQLVLQPGTERRRTSSHYTPRSLSAPIVRRTLEPLLAVMGEAPPSQRILNLKVCDPAMGSGAFLVEACRFLADYVLAAWTREGKVEEMAAEHGDPLLHARRLVAQRCLYGVDKNDAAVELAKLSLWLVTLSKTLPFTFLDHSMRHGDSLVGLDFDQIRNFHWKRSDTKPSEQLDLFGREIAVALDEAIQLRQRIGDLGDSPIDDREKGRLFWDAQDALDRVRLIGDVVVGAFFAHERDKDREAERVKRENLVQSWLVSAGTPNEELLAMQREARARVAPFHWMVEFPEVFYAERPDPLAHDEVNRAAYMDAFVGNPPFMGGHKVSGTLGVSFRDWLLCVHPSAEGRGDLSAHFIWRARSLLGSHGTAGLIATNSIAQGDTRETGLLAVIRHGGEIYEATSNLSWPGAANVSVAIVHFAVGAPAMRAGLRRILDGKEVKAINSLLRGAVERAAPAAVLANAGICYQGNMINGAGFLLTPEERQQYIDATPSNAEVIFPYLGGEEVNTSPSQNFHRYVINFGKRSVEEAARWPPLLDRVRLLVKSERDLIRDDTGKGGHAKKYWWQFLDRCDPLMDALGPLERCLVTANVTKHLVFAWQPKQRVLSNALRVFAFDGASQFCTLQSRVHEPWARLLSSSLEDRLRYSASDCFETFPFPRPNPRTVIPALDEIGQRLYDLRAKYMLDENVGLTITYNRLKDPACIEPRILELRKLHEEMDRTVLEAYGEGDPDGRWREIGVPPFCPMNDDDKKSVETFEDAVIDRLFALNGKRAAAEKATADAASTAKPTKKPATTKKNKPASEAKKPSALPIQTALPMGSTSSPPPWGPDTLAAVATSTGLPLSSGRWATTESGIDLGISALAAVLRTIGRPASPDEVECAVVRILLPRLLLSKFDKKSAGVWRKAVGADNLSKQSIAAFSIPWAATLERAVKERLLVVTLHEMWIAGPDIRDAPSRELDARALVSASWLAHVGQSAEVELAAELEILRVA